jgi:hypothetical protein
MWQQVLVAGGVLAATLYVVWTFMTLRARQRLLDAVAARGFCVTWAARHRERLGTGGCGRCAAAGHLKSAKIR